MSARPSMSRRCSAPLAVLLAVCALSAPARAQRGIDAETFRPSLDGFGLITVERAETSRQWDFGFKLTADYAHRPLSLALHAPGVAPDGLQPVLDWQAVLHVGAHFGLADWMELAFEIPVSMQSYGALYGSPYDDAARGPTGFYAGSARTNVPPPSAGVLDPRLALKLRARRFGPLGLGLVAAVTVPFGDDTAFLGDSGFTFRPTGIVDLTWSRFTLALNVGAILRTGRTVVLDPLPGAGAPAPAAPILVAVDHEITASLGMQVRLATWMAISVEAYALIPVGAIPNVDGSDASDRVVGALGALRFFPGRDVALSIGGGAGLPVNASAGPRQDLFRALLGLSWTPGDGGRGAGGGGSGDRDGDGVPDATDLCPDLPEDRDGIDDADGCPDSDNDGDGVPDSADRCPLEPEDRDGFQDGDGCPDYDNDGDGIPDAVKGPPDPNAFLDGCPDEPEDKDGFDDEDGCPEPDNDGDGILDAKDRCPNEAETANGFEDEDGCPDSTLGEPPPTGLAAQAAAAAAAMGGGGVTEVVLFDRNKSRVTSQSVASLERAASQLRDGTHRARIEAFLEYGERRGSLAADRVKVIQNELVHRGVNPALIDVAPGSGAAPGKNRKGPAWRRVEILITEGGR